MIFEIRRVNFINKGAELMMHAILEQVRAKYPDAKIVMQFKVGTKEQRELLDIGHLAYWNLESYKQFRHLRIIPNNIARIIPKNLLHQRNYYSDKDVDCVLDAAGFAYGDQWPARQCENTAEYYTQMKSWNKKVILLPQALGTFEKGAVKDACKRIFDVADLVFARDPDSYEYATSIAGQSSNIHRAPDFTNLVNVPNVDQFSHLMNRPIIIPNYRMIDKTDSSVADNYPNFLAKAVALLIENKLDPYLLIHESNKDKQLAEKVIQILGHDIEIVEESNPLLIKGIISKAYLSIGSRFHGLVSALSNGVPSIGTGWSHKYRRLFEDYDSLDFLLDPTSQIDILEEKLDSIMSESGNSKMREHLSAKSAEQKALTREMWGKVFAEIEA